VTSRQDGGTHTWIKPDVDATAAGSGAQCEVRIYDCARGPGDLPADSPSRGLRVGSPARHEAVKAQFRPRPRRRST
jgi:hypothetical protein